jgi:hypothetical protein
MTSSSIVNFNNFPSPVYKFCIAPFLTILEMKNLKLANKLCDNMVQIDLSLRIKVTRKTVNNSDLYCDMRFVDNENKTGLLNLDEVTIDNIIVKKIVYWKNNSVMCISKYSLRGKHLGSTNFDKYGNVTNTILINGDFTRHLKFFVGKSTDIFYVPSGNIKFEFNEYKNKTHGLVRNFNYAGQVTNEKFFDNGISILNPSVNQKSMFDRNNEWLDKLFGMSSATVDNEKYLAEWLAYRNSPLEELIYD